MADSLRLWCLNIWLILITHALLDAMTVYGTQLLLPFSDMPLGVASIFIIDPLYTLPLLAGLFWAIRWRGRRVLVITQDGYAEGFYSLLDGDRPIRFEHFARGMDLYRALQDNWEAARIAWFSRGFFAMSEQDGEVRITDLRMGQQPDYVFSFAVGRSDSTGLQSMPPISRSARVDIGLGFRWLGLRLLSANTPPLHHLLTPVAEPSH